MKHFLLILLLAFNAQAEVITLPNANNGFFASKADTVTIYAPAKDSRAVIVFLPGGHGNFNLTYEPTWVWMMLAPLKGRVDLVFMDSPYPLWNGGQGPRYTGDHIGRIRSTVEYYKAKTGKPVYLFGHSNGSVSIASFLEDSEYNQSIVDGVIFSGTAIGSVRKYKSMPSMVIHHAQDSCRGTPFSYAEKLHTDIKSMNKSTTVMIPITGGNDYGDSCTGMGSSHMYNGVYNKVADAIESFVK